MVFVKGEIFNENEDSFKFLKGKMYLHSSGEGIYQDDLKKYLWAAFGDRPQNVNNINYFNSILWAENGKRIIDFFGYHGLKNNWKGNPDVYSWVIDKKENYRWHNSGISITCGEGIILLGEEEKFRRTTKNLEEYMSKTLDLNGVNKLLKFS